MFHFAYSSTLTTAANTASAGAEMRTEALVVRTVASLGTFIVVNPDDGGHDCRDPIANGSCDGVI